MKSVRQAAVIFVLTVFAFSTFHLGHAGAHAPEITIHAKKFEFNPPEITLKQGQTVELVFVSDDVPHGIAFDKLDLHADFRKHHSARVLFTPAATGDFEGHCSVYCGIGHDRMKFVIHVTP